MSTPPKPRIAAFFDVDCTLLEVNSGKMWLARQWKDGEIGLFDAARFMMWLVLYRFGFLDFEKVAKLSLARYVGEREDKILAQMSRWSNEELVPWICKEARESIAEHREQGHLIVLLTSGTSFAVKALGETLGLEHLLCTEVQVRDGVLTADLEKPVCYGKGKVTKAEIFALQHGVDLDASFFYSDSTSDTPMLERVGHPVVVNPDPRMRFIANRRGWPVRRWRAARAA